MSRHVPRKGAGLPDAHDGQKVAFILSGGASLGAAQVGMLQALTESGIKPDLLIGTSVGAVNAAWMGAKPDHEGALELAEIWSSLRRGNVFPLSPWVSAAGLLGRCNHVIPNANLRALLQKHTPYRRLEEAKVPVHVITTELKSGRAAIMSSGPAVPALLASTAIPGVFPPVMIGRRYYVDGGVANHTPITVAIELGATDIYVLPVGYPWLLQEPTNALGMALYALARFVEQKLDAEVAASRDHALIHVLPTLDLPPVSPADFSRTAELIEKGYRSAGRYLAGAIDARQAPEPVEFPASGKALRLNPAPARAA